MTPRTDESLSSAADQDDAMNSLSDESPKKPVASQPQSGRIMADKKWIAIWFLCCINSVLFFSFDLPGTIGTGASPSTIQGRFAEYGKTYTQTMNGFLYSMYSWPTCVVAVLAGYLIDNVLGLYAAGATFNFLMLSCAIVFACGIRVANYSALVGARFLLGLSGDPSVIAQYMFLTRWFKGREGSALACSILGSFQRAGMATTFLTAPRLASAFGVDAVASVGIAVALASYLALGITIFFDKQMVRNGDLEPVVVKVLAPKAVSIANGRNDLNTKFQIGDEKSLTKIPLLLLSLYLAVISMGQMGLCAMGINFFMARSDLSREAAAAAVTTLYVVIIVVSPLLGALVDRTGYGVYWLVGAGSFATVLNIAYGHTTVINSFVFMGLHGVGQSMVLAALYPLIPYVVANSQLGLAFGVVLSLQNVGLGVVMVLNGWVLDRFTTTFPIVGALEACDPTIAHTSWTRFSYLGWQLQQQLERVELFSYSRAPGHVTETTASPISHSNHQTPFPCLQGFFAASDFGSVFFMASVLVGLLLWLMDRRHYGGLLSASAVRRKEMTEELEDLREAIVQGRKKAGLLAAPEMSLTYLASLKRRVESSSTEIPSPPVELEEQPLRTPVSSTMRLSA